MLEITNGLGTVQEKLFAYFEAFTYPLPIVKVYPNVISKNIQTEKEDKYYIYISLENMSEIYQVDQFSPATLSNNIAFLKLLIKIPSNKGTLEKQKLLDNLIGYFNFFREPNIFTRSYTSIDIKKDSIFSTTLLSIEIEFFTFWRSL